MPFPHPKGPCCPGAGTFLFREIVAYSHDTSTSQAMQEWVDGLAETDPSFPPWGSGQYAAFDSAADAAPTTTSIPSLGDSYVGLGDIGDSSGVAQNEGGFLAQRSQLQFSWTTTLLFIGLGVWYADGSYVAHPGITWGSTLYVPGTNEHPCKLDIQIVNPAFANTPTATPAFQTWIIGCACLSPATYILSSDSGRVIPGYTSLAAFAADKFPTVPTLGVYGPNWNPAGTGASPIVTLTTL